MTNNRAAIALLVALVVVVHVPFLGGGWMTDDFMHIDYLQRQHVVGLFLSPDVFGYFRPVSQASLFANLHIAAPHPFTFRLTSLALHLLVVAVAFVLARLMLGDGTAAFLSTLAFALAPKVNTIAVLWVSARPELLMSLFALGAVICWIRWDRGDGRGWFGGAVTCYVLAALSKEPIVLLPILLLVTPPGSSRRERVPAVGILVLSAVGAMVLRLIAGARIPFPDAFYNVNAPITQDLGNAWNYLTRAIPSPAALLVFSGVAATFTGTRASSGRQPGITGLGVYVIAWFFVLMLPVLPLPGRSELYLYLPGLGLCMFAGALASRFFARVRPRLAMIALGVYVAALGGYQFFRALEMHRVLAFSAKLERAFQSDDRVRDYSGVLVLVPDDAATERVLRDSIGGYLDVAIKVMLGRRDVGGAIAYTGDVTPAAGLRLNCAYRDGEVVLRSFGT